jgi:hypothetical protein
MKAKFCDILLFEKNSIYLVDICLFFLCLTTALYFANYS